MTYSRFKDTSLVPRFPLGVGNRPSAREHLHTLMSRDPELIRRTIGDVVKLKALLRKTGEGNPDDVIDNHIDTGRLKDINNKHTQRQLHRNRKQQQLRKIIETVVGMIDTDGSHDRWRMKANSTRRKRIVHNPSADPNDPSEKRRHLRSYVDNFSHWKGADVDSN